MRDRVLTVAASVLKVPAAALSDASSPDTIDSWDSLQHMQVILALEEEFSIQFPADAIDRLQTIGEMVAAVQERAR